MKTYLVILFQILLLQKCQGFFPLLEKDAVQILNAQKGECQPWYGNLKKYVCSDVSGDVDLSGKYWQLPRDLQSLTIKDSENLTMNLATLTYFNKLTNLTIQDSQVMELKLNGSIPEQIKVLKFIRCWSHSLQAVNLFDTRQLDLHQKVINSLGGLEELHIINCSLSSLTQPELPIEINISGGSINCLSPNHERLPYSHRLVDFLWMGDWIKYKNASLADDVMCFLNVKYFGSLYGLNYMSIKTKIEVEQDLLEHCPSACKCLLSGLTFSAKTGEWIPMVEVDCNNVSLTNLPTTIPKYTTQFQARYNNITDINPLFENEAYFSIHRILLDHNQIRMVDGDKFYNYLMTRNLDFALDLSHNQIEELPVRKISKAYALRWTKFDQHFLPLFKINNNPFNCKQCDFLVDFQDILTRYWHSFVFPQDIRCSSSSDNLPVLSLDVNTPCATDEPYLENNNLIKVELNV